MKDICHDAFKRDPVKSSLRVITKGVEDYAECSAGGGSDKD
jgi:hypothetical protein